jgi:alpha-L-fucosidase 2
VKKSLFVFFSFWLVSGYAQDLKLWYKQPAAKWTDALPIGNGRIGAMVFGGLETDRIQFNEETLWTGSPRDYNRKGAYQYLPQIRQLLQQGKQKEAEALAEAQFMGRKSDEGNRELWIKQMQSIKQGAANPANPSFDDSKWSVMKVPSYEGWEAVGYEGLDGAVWLRTSFELPADWQGKNLVLDLNRVRDLDYTYVNGKLVGSTESNEARRYTIPKEALHPRKNVLAIQVLNFFDKGGVAGYKDTTRHIGLYPEGQEAAKLSLNGNWKYFIQNDNPPPTPHYQADYQPFGDLLLHFAGTGGVTDYRRELDLETAIVQTAYTQNGTQFTREYLVSQPAQVIAIHLSGSKPGSISFDAELSSPHKNFSVKKQNGNTLSLSVQVRNGALHGESELQVQAPGGTVTVENNRLVV